MVACEDLLNLFSPNVLLSPQWHLCASCLRVFALAVPSVWYTLPPDAQMAKSLTSFTSLCQCHLLSETTLFIITAHYPQSSWSPSLISFFNGEYHLLISYIVYLYYVDCFGSSPTTVQVLWGQGFLSVCVLMYARCPEPHFLHSSLSITIYWMNEWHLQLIDHFPIWGFLWASKLSGTFQMRKQVQRGWITCLRLCSMF